jgi:alpha-L-fucosidase
MAKKFNDERDWFLEKRFGLFVHWGLYAIPGWHEQHQWRGRVPAHEYVKLANKWNPEKFDANAWLDLAESTGMKYIVITTKHHDGFCLWDTKHTDFNTMHTPYGKDILAQLADACHKRNFPLGFYYSCADWHHPNYPNQGRHHELDGPKPGDEPDLMKYLDFLRAQVRELCTNYGEIHAFWWDMNVDEHVDPSINNMIRELQPKAVINNRGYDEGDFGTPERDYVQGIDEKRDFDRLTEACQSVGIESWGYRVNEDYYTDRHLMRSIARYLARDANYLLNVGPKPDGTVSETSVGILNRIGKWYHAVKESFDNVEPVSNLTRNKEVLLTRKDNVIYVHLVNDPRTSGVKLDPIQVMPKSATLLNTGEPVKFKVDLVPSNHVEHKPYLRLQSLPANELANTVMVVKLEFEQALDLSEAVVQDDHVPISAR